MTQKRNVDVFNADVAETSGQYKYTLEDSLSKRLANERMTRGITEAANFRGKRVLDVGCGDGTFTLALAEAGAKSVLGFDPAGIAIEAAREKAKKANVDDRVTFQMMNVYDFETLDTRFDIAVLRGVLHHLPDAEAAVRLTAKVADEIVILEPNGANPVLKIIERVSPYHIAHEEQSFHPRTINRWLKNSGCEIVRSKLITLVPIFCPSMIARILKALEPLVEAIPLLRLLSCGQYVVVARSGPIPLATKRADQNAVGKRAHGEAVHN